MTDTTALLVGINQYPTPEDKLRGCVNDILCMKRILIETFDVDPNRIRIITDQRATKNHIMDRLNWLVHQNSKNLLFYYSCHGSQMRNKVWDRDDVESDFLDELICPVDFDWDENYILDDDIHSLTEVINPDQHMTIIADSCHSGTIYRGIAPKADWKAKYIPAPVDILNRIPDIDALSGGNAEDTLDKSHWFVDGIKSFFTHWFPKKPKQIKENVVSIAACEDDEVSADTYFGGKRGRFQGAFSFFFQYYLVKYPDKTLNEIIEKATRMLKRYKYPQTPVYTGVDRRLIT